MNKIFDNLKVLKYLCCVLFVTIASVFCFQLFQAQAATNTDVYYRWAWNDTIGWIDFYITGNVNTTSTEMNGYASSSVGYIALDCATSPNGNICGTSNFGVDNDGNGTLSGYAWNDGIGWISFNCSNTGTCATSNYSVTVSNGVFSGWAWNDIVGWISFNCNNSGIGNTCGTSDYKLQTSWAAEALSAELTSSVFDTGVEGGASLQTVMWQGSQPSDTSVKFRIASSNCSNGATNYPTCSTGTWSYLGSDGSATTYYTPTGPDSQVKLRRADHGNKRYFRYQVFLFSDSAQTTSPTVRDVIISYTP